MGHPRDENHGITPKQRGLPPKESSLPDLADAFDTTVKERSQSVDLLDPENFRATELYKPPVTSNKTGPKELGTLIDKYWDDLVPDSKIPRGNKQQQKVYTSTNTIYIDRIDYTEGVIYEIKPHAHRKTPENKRARGFDQAENYANYMDNQHPLPHGRKWKVKVVYYNPSDLAQRALQMNYITQQDYDALPEHWRRPGASSGTGDPAIHHRAVPVRRNTVQKIMAKRKKADASGPRVKKMRGAVPGGGDIVQAVFEYSGAAEIVGEQADKISDLITGTGGPTPEDRAIKKHNVVIEKELDYLKKQHSRRALWAAYMKGEFLYANTIIRVSSIVRPATLGLGNRPVHMHIYAIVPQILSYHTHALGLEVFIADEGKKTGVTKENFLRLQKSGLLYRKYDYLITPGIKLFYSGEVLQGTVYSYYEKVNLSALRTALPPITGIWNEMEGPVKTAKYAQTVVSDRLFEQSLHKPSMLNDLRAEYTISYDATGISVIGRPLRQNEEGKFHSWKTEYPIKRVIWDQHLRSLSFILHQPKQMHLIYSLRQIDAGLMVGEVDITTGFLEQTQQYHVHETRYVIFRRSDKFNVMHHVKPVKPDFDFAKSKRSL